MNTSPIPTPEAGDTLTPSGENPRQTLVSASAVTAAVTEGLEGTAEPGRPVEGSRSHMPMRAPVAVSQQAFPSFMRRYIDVPGASGPEVDQPRPLPEAHFVPRLLRGAASVTPSITPPETPTPKTSFVTGTMAGTAVAGSICPTCGCRVPARLSAADRQRAYRERKRDKRSNS